MHSSSSSSFESRVAWTAEEEEEEFICHVTKQ